MVRHAPNSLKIIFLLVAGVAFFSRGVSSQAAGSKTAAPDWQLSDVDGKPVKLSDFGRHFGFLGYLVSTLPRRNPWVCCNPKEVCRQRLHRYWRLSRQARPVSGEAFHARIGDELSRGHGKSKNCR